MDGRSESRWNEVRRRAYMAANYRLRTFAGGRWADRCRPTDIGFLMTNLCNAKCVHCDIWKNKGKDDTPTIDQYKATLNDMRSWLGPVHVFFSGGEALLRPYTPEILRHAASVGLFAEILTHGYWDDQSRIEKAALANPSRITVSLDGIGEAHTTIRGRCQAASCVPSSRHRSLCLATAIGLRCSCHRSRRPANATKSSSFSISSMSSSGPGSTRRSRHALRSRAPAEPDCRRASRSVTSRALRARASSHGSRRCRRARAHWARAARL